MVIRCEMKFHENVSSIDSGLLFVSSIDSGIIRRKKSRKGLIMSFTKVDEFCSSLPKICNSFPNYILD